MNIAIAGYGLEGESSFRYYSKFKDNKITIVDQKMPSRSLPEGVSTIISEDVFDKNLDGYDLVVRTASLSPYKIHTDGKIWSATNEFFSKCPAVIIGVTGTKGKGTIASLIASILESAGKKVWLVGNIGVPALDYLESIGVDDYVVYELSSFQLWDLEFSPNISVISLIEPEHLDVHKDFDDYIGAKANIRLHQKSDDVCIFHPFNRVSEKIAKSIDFGKVYKYGVKESIGVYVDESFFCCGDQKICSVDCLKLIGQHNVENACAAISVAKELDVTNKDIENGLVSFLGLPHRLEFVRDFEGVKYYNDSFSSSTPATIAAINSFNQPEILILGGIDRGGNFADISKAIQNNDNVKSIIIIGQIRDKLEKIIKDNNCSVEVVNCEYKDMKDIVGLAKNMASAGDVVLLSPGCASFDMFKDFYDRGDQFKKAVNEL